MTDQALKPDISDLLGVLSDSMWFVVAFVLVVVGKLLHWGTARQVLNAINDAQSGRRLRSWEFNDPVRVAALGDVFVWAGAVVLVYASVRTIRAGLASRSA